MLVNELLKKYVIEAPECILYYKGELVDYINEYTLRNIQLAVKKGELKKEDISFFYDNKYYTIINDIGDLNDTIPTLMDSTYELVKKRIF